MKHWVTEQEMGEGFQFNEKDHKENGYNSLEKPMEHETNLMRTYYLIRDVWNKETKEALKDFLDNNLTEENDK